MRESETYTYEKNRRYQVNAGTRCSFVKEEILFRQEESNRQHGVVRNICTSLAISKAARLWEAEWGPVPWDLVQILVTHVTTQVVVEFRVVE